MLDPKTLRGRLSLGYALALAVALVVFAAAAIAAMDTVQRQTIDAQLAAAARGVGAIVDEHDGRLTLDQNDRRQFVQILGLGLGGALFGDRNTLIATNAPAIPAEVTRLRDAAKPKDELQTVDSGRLRVLVRGVVRNGQTLGALVIWKSTDTIVESDVRAAVAFTFVIPIVALLAIVFGSLIAQRGLRPLEAMSTVASEIEARDLSRRLATDGAPVELARLGRAFNRMLDRLEAAFERQREFTADASHELRAPLSVIRAEADLALLRERDAPAYREALAAIAREADELERLTRDLLAAARAEAGAVQPVEVLDFGALAEQVVRRLQPLARARDIDLRCTTASIAVEAAPDDLERALLSIVHNALKFTREGGRVAVTVAERQGSAEFVVADDGPGFSPEALERALDRFWRADSARTSGQGSGLGLALAKAVVESAAGVVALANGRSGGASVTVRLPTCSTNPPLAGGLAHSQQ